MTTNEEKGFEVVTEGLATEEEMAMESLDLTEPQTESAIPTADDGIVPVSDEQAKKEHEEAGADEQTGTDEQAASEQPTAETEADAEYGESAAIPEPGDPAAAEGSAAAAQVTTEEATGTTEAAVEESDPVSPEEKPPAKKPGRPGRPKKAKQAEAEEEVITPLTEEEMQDILFAETEALPDNDEEDMLEAGEKAVSTALQAARRNQAIGPDKGRYVSGRKKTIDYGGESKHDKMLLTYRALEAARSNRNILEGIVLSASMFELPDDMEEVVFEVAIKAVDNKYLDGNIVLISGENMTNILRWDGTLKTKQDILQKRRRFAKGMLDAEIQFYIDKIFVQNPEERDITMREYDIIGNRVACNEDLKRRYFDQGKFDSLEVGDIVNGKVITVSSNKVTFTVAGVDLYLNINSAYITGLSRVIPRGLSGKKMIEINEDKECLIVEIGRNEETGEVNALRVSFYEPIKGRLMKKIESMKIGSLHSGTILRYVPPKENGRPAYLIVKADSGIEVVCDVPSWKVMPKELDSVKIKVVGTQPERGSVRGYIKR